MIARGAPFKGNPEGSRLFSNWRKTEIGEGIQCHIRTMPKSNRLSNEHKITE